MKQRPVAFLRARSVPRAKKERMEHIAQLLAAAPTLTLTSAECGGFRQTESRYSQVDPDYHKGKRSELFRSLRAFVLKRRFLLPVSISGEPLIFCRIPRVSIWGELFLFLFPRKASLPKTKKGGEVAKGELWLFWVEEGRRSFFPAVPE